MATTGSPKTSPHLANGPIRGEQDAAAFVPTADELKEDVYGVRLNGQVAQFIDDQQLGFGKVQQLLVEEPLRMRLHELRDERGRAGKQDRVAGGDRGATEPDAQVRFPTPGGPSKSSDSPFAMKRPESRSLICCLSTAGCAAKS